MTARLAILSFLAVVASSAAAQDIGALSRKAKRNVLAREIWSEPGSHVS
jgi:hypothetical protein